MKKTVHIVSLGCPKNLIDSEVIAASFVRGGYDITPHPEEASLILVNTCTFILPAKEESIDEILRMAEMKRKGACRHLVVAGCLPQRYGSVLEEELPEVDLFVGTGEIPHIAALIEQLAKKGSVSPRSHVGTPTFLMTSSHPRLILTPPHTAYLKIAEGCSNMCSYCVIPLVRGQFRSRQMDDIVREAEVLAAGGAKELIMTAQETTAYGRDLEGKPTLAQLLKAIASIEGVQWIRVLYTHPLSITNDLLTTISGVEEICNYMDIPVQHIHDDILKSMNRRGRSDTIRGIIQNVREVIPGVALRTSLMVGYPGETQERFDALLSFVNEVRFDHLGVFTYSREEGTRAAGLPHQVPEREKEARRNIIMEEQAIISYEINTSLVGSIQEVLIEEPSDIPDFTYTGRLRRQAPDIDGITYVKAGAPQRGDIIRCRIVRADTYDLYAEELS